MAGHNPQQRTDTASQNLPTNVSVTSPMDIKDSLHELIWRQLPTYLKQAAEQHGTSFDDCRLEYYQDYRVILITSEGLGVDMDHRQNDVNYFQAEAIDIAYCEDEVKYIEDRKARQYDSYAQISLFRAIWTDVVEAVGDVKPGPGILQP